MGRKAFRRSGLCPGSPPWRRRALPLQGATRTPCTWLPSLRYNNLSPPSHQFAAGAGTCAALPSGSTHCGTAARGQRRLGAGKATIELERPVDRKAHAAVGARRGLVGSLFHPDFRAGRIGQSALQRRRLGPAAAVAHAVRCTRHAPDACTAPTHHSRGSTHNRGRHVRANRWQGKGRFMAVLTFSEQCLQAALLPALQGMANAMWPGC